MQSWNTAITDVRPNEIRLRGYRIDDLMGRVDFGRALHLLLRGELPDEKVGRLMTAILVSSAHAARSAASTGAPLSACVASGVLSINRCHGGAIEDCAGALAEVVALANEQKCSLDEAADQVLTDYESRKMRVAGLGHLIHTADPRTARLFDLASKAGVSGRYVEACKALEAAMERRLGRRLPININGAIGAVLLELGFEFEVMNGFFILARVAGLIAQAREEATRERKMRTIAPGSHRYDGPPPQSV